MCPDTVTGFKTSSKFSSRRNADQPYVLRYRNDAPLLSVTNRRSCIWAARGRVPVASNQVAPLSLLFQSWALLARYIARGVLRSVVAAVNEDVGVGAGAVGVTSAQAAPPYRKTRGPAMAKIGEAPTAAKRATPMVLPGIVSSVTAHAGVSKRKTLPLFMPTRIALPSKEAIAVAE